MDIKKILKTIETIDRKKAEELLILTSLEIIGLGGDQFDFSKKIGSESSLPVFLLRGVTSPKTGHDGLVRK